MANATAFSANQVETHSWNVPRELNNLGAESVSTAVTFYTGQFMGRDASGLAVQMDDTAKAEFLGVTGTIVPITVAVGDAASLNLIKEVFQPQLFKALIASCAQGDEGKKVYVKDNQSVQYTPGAYGNLAGRVWKVPIGDTTHVVCTPPWLRHMADGDAQGMDTFPVTGAATLTKWDVNTIFTSANTGNTTISLPVSTKCSPGDFIEVIKTSSNNVTIAFAVQGSDSINAATANVASATTQFGVSKLRTDGNGNWYEKNY